MLWEHWRLRNNRQLRAVEEEGEERQNLSTPWENACWGVDCHISIVETVFHSFFIHGRKCWARNIKKNIFLLLLNACMFEKAQHRNPLHCLRHRMVIARYEAARQIFWNICENVFAQTSTASNSRQVELSENEENEMKQIVYVQTFSLRLSIHVWRVRISKSSRTIERTLCDVQKRLRFL